MAFSFYFDRSNNLSHVTFGHTITMDDLKYYVDQISKQQIRKHFYEIIDFNIAKTIASSYDYYNDFHRYYEILNDLYLLDGSIFCVHTPFQYGVARMLQVMLADVIPIRIVHKKELIKSELRLFKKETQMAELKTKKNDASVDAFLNQVEDIEKRKDSYTILNLMKKITKVEPKMWGTSIIGFGAYRYKYATGREGDWFQVGFSPRKQSLTLYLMSSSIAEHADLFKKLGKHTVSKGCLYIKKLEQIDMKILEEIIRQSLKKSSSA